MRRVGPTDAKGPPDTRECTPEVREPRVLFIVHQIGSGADGGIRSLAEIARSVPDLAELIVTNIESPYTDALRAFAPVEIWPMDEPSYRGTAWSLQRRVGQLRSRLRNNFRTWRTIRARGVGVVHANEQRAFWNSALGAKLAGAPLIFNVRDTMRAESRSLPFWRRALSLCDRFLVLSGEMVEAWRRDLKPVSARPENARKFAFLYSIVDDTRHFALDAADRTALRAKLGVDDDRPAIVYVGRFDGKKAQRDFIERALPKIRQARPDAVTFFVGDFEPNRDPYAASCAAAVRQLGLEENVRFVGYSPEPADWYRIADVVALASRREGLPRCMIESIACGAAFVTFDVCSTREILEGHNCGMVVPQGDYAALARQIVCLLSDRRKLTEYQRRGPHVAGQLFNEKVNAALYRDLVRTLSRAEA